MRRISLLMCLLVLGVVGIASAQLPVVEVGKNLAFNGVQAAEAVFQSAQWVIDLAPLEAWEIVEAMRGCLGASSPTLAAEAQAIGMDIASIQAQLDGALRPRACARHQLCATAQRVAEINRRIWQVYGYAMRTQTLINTIIHTVEHIIGFVESSGRALGQAERPADALAAARQAAAAASGGEPRPDGEGLCAKRRGAGPWGVAAGVSEYHRRHDGGPPQVVTRP